MKGFNTIEHIWRGTAPLCDRCGLRGLVIQIGIVLEIGEQQEHGVQLCEKCLQELRDKLVKILQ